MGTRGMIRMVCSWRKGDQRALRKRRSCELSPIRGSSLAGSKLVDRFGIHSYEELGGETGRAERGSGVGLGECVHVENFCLLSLSTAHCNF